VAGQSLVAQQTREWLLHLQHIDHELTQSHACGLLCSYLEEDARLDSGWIRHIPWAKRCRFVLDQLTATLEMFATRVKQQYTFAPIGTWCRIQGGAHYTSLPLLMPSMQSACGFNSRCTHAGRATPKQGDVVCRPNMHFGCHAVQAQKYYTAIHTFSWALTPYGVALTAVHNWYKDAREQGR